MRLSTLIHLQGLLVALGLGLLAALVAVTGRDVRHNVYALEVTLSTTAPGRAQVYFDRGADLNEADSSAMFLTGDAAPQALRFPLWPGPLKVLRFDPFDGSGEAILADARIVSRGGHVVYAIPLHATQARDQIGLLEPLENGGVKIVTAPNAHDPSVNLQLPDGLVLPYSIAMWFRPALVAFVCVGGITFLVLGLRLTRNGKTAGEWFSAWAGVHPWAALSLWTVPLWLCALVALPLPPDDNLDASWQMTLIYAHQHGLQFGRDLVFTAGPWGYLFSHFYIEPALLPKVLWEIFGKLGLAALFVAATSGISWARRATFLFGMVLLGGLVLDTWLILLVTLLVLNVLLRQGRPPLAIAVALAVLTFLAHVKFTLLVLGAAGTAVAAVAWLWRGDARRAITIAAGYAGGILGWWLAAGQNPIRLPRFLRLSGEIASGYPSAMALDGNAGVFPLALAVLLVLGVYLYRQARRCAVDDRAEVWPALAIVAGALFVVWKHGLTRADGHALIFFFSAGLLAILVPAIVGRTKGFAGVELTVLLCLAGAWCVDDAIVARSPHLALRHAQMALHPVFAPGNYLELWRNSAQSARDRLDLPEVRKQVGDASIDYFRHHQGRLIATGFNYRPRIVIQGYSAYTPELLDRNLGWIQRDDRAPQFFLADYETIDGRFPTQGDSLVLADLPRRYERVSRTDRFLLLRRRTEQPAPDGLPRRRIPIGQPGFGTNLTLPVVGEHPLWLRVHTPLSMLGRARALLYKPPQLRIIVTGFDGTESNYRLIPGMAEEGFLIQPFVQSLDDLDRFLIGQGTKWLRSIRIEHLPGEGEFWLSPRVELEELTAISTKGYHPAILEELGIFNLAPTLVDLPVGMEPFTVDNRPAVLAHSPGMLQFQPAPGVRMLHGWYGLRDGSYSDGAQTDGVGFRIEVLRPDGSRDVLWQRFLDPFNRIPDRGPQPLELALPELSAGSTIVLTTDPGPAGDTRWDWSYWSQLRFEP